MTLLGGAPNPRAVHSSKAVGEPPFFLSSSVFFALKDAVRSARIQLLGPKAGSKFLQLHAPLTSERLRMACQDQLVAVFGKQDEYDQEEDAGHAGTGTRSEGVVTVCTSY